MRAAARSLFLRRKWLAAAFVAGLAALGGCAPDYVMRAAYEEAKLLWRRQPIDRLLRNHGLAPGRRDKLELVLRARAFARDHLGLHVDGSYSSISEVDGGAIVQLLTASRRDRLERYTWWFPIVGRVPYKGFFSKKTALRMAEGLEAEGYDTYVRPAMAFSTLGWFDDPLPSTLLERNRVTLANVVVHELFHNTVFLRGEVVFNESAANFVGHRAAVDLFCGSPAAEEKDCQAARDEWEDARRMSRFVAMAVTELEDFYSSSPNADELRKGRERIFASIRERAAALELRGGRYMGFAGAPLNNATLLHDWIYLRDLDLFEELYARAGSLRRAIEALRDIVAESKEPFVRLRRLLQDPPLDVASG
ncbi:MAG: aminopeptidase [Candidatus Binatia bacterium]